MRTNEQIAAVHAAMGQADREEFATEGGGGNLPPTVVKVRVTGDATADLRQIKAFISEDSAIAGEGVMDDGEELVVLRAYHTAQDRGWRWSGGAGGAMDPRMASKREIKRDSGRFVWRDDKTGCYLDVKVAKPQVRPHGVPIEKIRKAVEESGGGSVRKKK